MTEKFVVGIAGAPFGVKGFLKVRPCSDEIDHLLQLKEVSISKDGKERLLRVEESAPLANQAVMMRFAGIDCPEKAKPLSGAKLLAGREDASPLKDGEFYVEDLKGMEVTIGHITDIIEGGGGEIAEIKLATGETKLVPFRREFFAEIDPEKGRVTLKNLWILE